MISPVEGALINSYRVTPGHLATVGTSVLQGRDFLPEEEGESSVILVNEALAEAGWPGRSPLGQCIRVRRYSGDQPAFESCVIGVVENTLFGSSRAPPELRATLRDDQPQPLFYEALKRDDTATRRLFVRAAPGATLGAGTLRSALLDVEPHLPYVHIERLGAPLEPQIRPWRLGARVFLAFAVLATFLTAVGLYSSLGYFVTQRIRELGIRAAIGASSSSIAWLVVRGVMRVLAVGLVLGLAFSLFGGWWIGDLLFDVSATDPLVFLAAILLLLVVALLASFIPVRRAIRLDPAAAMRSE